VLEAVPELADQVEPRVDRQATDFLTRELHQASVQSNPRSDKAAYGN
jgi:hypothetical protein